MDKKTNLIGYPIVIILTAIITFLILKNCDKSGPEPPIVIAPKEIISLEDAKQLYYSYSDNRACIIEVFEGQRDSTLTSLCPTNRKPNEKFVPSRSFHLTKEFLNQYIAYLDKITDTIDITGYRLYLGNYPDAKEFKDGKPIPDPRRNTFFIAPTTLIPGSDLHRGFTFVDRNNDGVSEVLFLEDELDRKRSNQNTQSAKINTAGFFSFASTRGRDRSTLANELGGHPPKDD